MVTNKNNFLEYKKDDIESEQKKLCMVFIFKLLKMSNAAMKQQLQQRTSLFTSRRLTMLHWKKDIQSHTHSREFLS